MFTKRYFFLFVTLMSTGLAAAGLPGNAHAAGHIRAASSRPSDLIKGTWDSAKGSLTFRQDGTIIYRGKRYYYAVSTGGTIQLTGRHGSVTIPYNLVGDRLTLTTNGKATVYTRRR